MWPWSSYLVLLWQRQACAACANVTATTAGCGHTSAAGNWHTFSMVIIDGQRRAGAHFHRYADRALSATPLDPAVAQFLTLERYSTVIAGRRASMTGMSATDTPALAWRAVECEEEQEENQRSPDQRRLEGLFAIDPADFAPGVCLGVCCVASSPQHLRPTIGPYGTRQFICCPMHPQSLILISRI